MTGWKPIPTWFRHGSAMAILGIGTEIIECVRISKMIETHGEQFLERVYTPNEIEYCFGTANAPQRFAKRWAAKEAVMRALHCRNRGVQWTDIEILMTTEGPAVILNGAAAAHAEEVGIEKLHIALSACRTHATAYVMATDEIE
jgi:holo-[acyl-carrier protein] synthase